MDGSTAIFGAPQSGKTLYGVHLFRQTRPPDKAVFVEPRWRPDKFPGEKWVRTPQEVAHALSPAGENRDRVVWFIHSEEAGDLLAFVAGADGIRSKMFLAGKVPPPLVVYVDEVDTFTGTGPALDTPIVRAITKMGNVNIRSVVIVQRPAMVSRNTWGNAWEWVYYRMGKGDYKTVLQETGVADRETVAAIREWHEAAPYHYVRLDVQGRWWFGDAAYHEEQYEGGDDAEDGEEDDDEGEEPGDDTDSAVAPAEVGPVDAGGDVPRV